MSVTISNFHDLKWTVLVRSLMFWVALIHKGRILHFAATWTYLSRIQTRVPQAIWGVCLDLCGSNEWKPKETAKYVPFFQAFIDYRMGQRKRMPFGPDNMLEFRV
ncbi:hypothetical protein J3459_014263 [Metarhizium acridum]|nr:hypothetical protein J3459_014263 [Metarhizium acridum]